MFVKGSMTNSGKPAEESSARDTAQQQDFTFSLSA